MGVVTVLKMITEVFLSGGCSGRVWNLLYHLKLPHDRSCVSHRNTKNEIGILPLKGRLEHSLSLLPPPAQCQVQTQDHHGCCFTHTDSLPSRSSHGSLFTETLLHWNCVLLCTICSHEQLYKVAIACRAERKYSWVPSKAQSVTGKAQHL